MNVGDSVTSERREFTDPESGRKITQLTSGDCFDYQLYYFIPTMTKDSRTVVFHRHQDMEVQLFKIDIGTGLTTKLTDAKTPNSLWRPYLQEEGRGVRDLMSAFNTATNEAVYFDTNDIRAVNIPTLADRVLYHVPDDRVPCGLTGVSPDGKWFCFVHADKAWWDASRGRKPDKCDATGCRLDVLAIATGEARTLVQINTWLTHSNFYDNDRILFCHLPTEGGALMTDLRGGWYMNLRTQDEAGGCVCHYLPTDRGIMYETAGGGRLIGILNPDNLERVEYKNGVPGGIHTGADPEGRLWFYEGTCDQGRLIAYYERLQPGVVNQPLTLVSPREPYWLGQRIHMHPQITPDRKFILFTGGDPTSKTNHLFLVDVDGLKDTELDT